MLQLDKFHQNGEQINIAVGHDCDFVHIVSAKYTVHF